jgi:hypothetical protein
MRSDDDLKGGIMAERKYYIDDEVVDAEVTVRVGYPLQPPADYFRCPYEIVTRTGKESGFVPGVDALDSIMATLALIGTKLAGLNDALFHGKLRWEGGEGTSGLGLPTIEDHWPLREIYRSAAKEEPKEEPKGGTR